MSLFASIMADHPDEDWGKISYPVREDIREAAGGDTLIASNVRAVLHTNQTYWEKLIDRIVQANPTSNPTSSAGLQRLCRRATTYQGTRELSILNDGELDALMEAVVTET